MAKFTSRADLLIAAGESIKMQEKAGVNEPVVKYNGEIAACDELNYTTRQHGEYEFPLAVVEGKPVFVGDELYHSPFGDGEWYKFTVAEEHKNSGGVTPLEKCLWTKPKPATVMVELLREDAEWCVQSQCAFYNGRLAEACRKALEKA